MLSVDVTSLTLERQCITTPSSDDSVATAETFSKERNSEIAEELQMQLQG